MPRYRLTVEYDGSDYVGWQRQDYCLSVPAAIEKAALAARADGDASDDSVSISRDLEMSQFWQNRQARLQPAVPNDSTDEPGRKWFSGFFSIGSTQNPDDRP